MIGKRTITVVTTFGRMSLQSSRQVEAPSPIGGLDELALPQRQDLAPHRPADVRDVDDPDDEDREQEAPRFEAERPERQAAREQDGREADREQVDREGPDDVEQARQHAVDDAAEEARR